MKNKDKKEYNFPESVIAVFAKQPMLGRVKTRLEGVTGREGALLLHKQLIRYVFLNIQAAGLCPIQLWVAHESLSNQHDEVFLTICNKKNIHYQDGADLGARMEWAARHALATADSVILVGADCPSVDGDYIQQALSALAGGVPVVIGPAEDGGYVLIGLSEIPPRLFNDIDWGTSQVLSQTRQRLQEAGSEWVELAPKWDVDRPEDLSRLETLEPHFPMP
jgi:rSAM/selenodomain-associated transferase 1